MLMGVYINYIFMNLGYDYIVIETNDIVSFFKRNQKHQLTLFHLHQLDTLRYSFYVPISKIYHIFYAFTYSKKYRPTSLFISYL